MDSWICVLCVFVSIWTHGYGFNPILLYLFGCSNCSSFDHYEFFQFTLAFLWHVYYFVIFWHYNGLQTHSPWLNPRINHFCKEPWFLSWENGIRNQALGTKCAHCHWGVTTCMPFLLTEQGSTCVHINPCTHKYLYIFVYVTFCIYTNIHLSSCWCLYTAVKWS